MSVIKIKVDNETATIMKGTTEEINSGDIRTVSIEFSFSKEWEGYKRTAVIYTGMYEKEQAVRILMSDDKVYGADIPSSIFKESCYLNLVYIYSRYSDENPTINKYGQIVLKADEVLHIPGLGFDGLIGYSPIAMARNAVGMTMACEEYGASFFANGANPGGVLEHPGILKDPSKVRNSWNSVYRGSNNAHKIAVLEEGMKYQQIGIPPEEAQFLETRNFQINEIARLYRIPPHMVGDLEKSSFSNIEQQSLEFVKYTLDPWVIRWEQALKKALLLPTEKKEYAIRLNVDGLLRGDYQSRMNGYSVGRQNGWLSTNDIREMEDMNPLSDEEGGNLYLINGSMTKLKDAGAFAKTDTSENDNTESTAEEIEDKKIRRF